MFDYRKADMKKESTVPTELIEQRIYIIRGDKVMLDFHLAELYSVETKVLKRAVRRNLDRFPEDFMFKLNRDEYNSLRYQIGTLKRGEHAKYLPFAFTEQGVAMLSSVLRSKRAIQVNIAIMRAFVKLRNILATHEELRKKLEDLERKFERHDEQIKLVFDAIRELMQPPKKPKRKIGFRVEERRKRYRTK
jgi:phage regulator Rha-like protein